MISSSKTHVNSRPTNESRVTTPYPRRFIYTCPDHIFHDTTISINELKIYMMIRSFLDNNDSAYPSNRYIAQTLKINFRSVPRCIASLENKKYLFRVRDGSRRYLTIVDPNRHGQTEDKGGKVQEDGGKLESRGEDTDVRGGGHSCHGGVTPVSWGGDTDVTQLLQRKITSNIDKKEKVNQKEKSVVSKSKNKLLSSAAPKTNESKEMIDPNRKYRETLYPMPQSKNSTSNNQGLALPEIQNINPHNIPVGMIRDWMLVRAAKKVPVTETAWSRLNAQLARCEDAIEAFEIMVSHGWTSLNHKWIQNHLGNKRTMLDDELDSTDWVNRV